MSGPFFLAHIEYSGSSRIRQGAPNRAVATRFLMLLEVLVEGKGGDKKRKTDTATQLGHLSQAFCGRGNRSFASSQKADEDQLAASW